MCTLVFSMISQIGIFICEIIGKETDLIIANKVFTLPFYLLKLKIGEGFS